MSNETLRWGADDTQGAMNLITPETTLAALSLIRKGITYDLSRVLKGTMSTPEFHGQFFANTNYTLENGAEWHNEKIGAMENGYSAQNLRISMCDHSGTHIDQLNHVGVRGDDGKYRVYNGIENQDIITSFGTKELGAEHMRSWVGRGILADVAALHGVEWLDAGYVIQPDEIDRALAAAEVEVHQADTVFVHTGWGKKWDDPDYLEGEPGLGKACAGWAREKDIVCWGVDQWGVDVFPFETEGEALPVHIDLLTSAGIRLIENIDMSGLLRDGVYELCIVGAPLRVLGGTGAPLPLVGVV